MASQFDRFEIFPELDQGTTHTVDSLIVARIFFYLRLITLIHFYLCKIFVARAILSDCEQWDFIR